MCVKECIKFSNKCVFNDALSGNKYSIKYVLKKVSNPAINLY